MNRFEKRRLKRNIYKHGNAIMYIGIFVMASVITIAAAANRTDKIAYIDDTQIASTAKESVNIKNSDNQKVALAETGTEQNTTMQNTSAENITTPQTTEPDTTPQVNEPAASAKIRITADSLNIRAEASKDSEPVGSAVQGQEFEVISHQGDWIKIDFGGMQGYISAEFAEVVE